MRRWFVIVACFSASVAVFLLYACLPRSSIPAMVQQPTFVTLVLDAGHGGEDGGAVSVDGKKESDVNLAVSLRSRDLAALLGIPCVLTRDDDRSLHSVSGTVAQRKASDIKNRVSLVNSVANALLVSVHQNHFPQGKYHGAQVFYADTVGSESLAIRMQQLLRESLDSTNHRAVKRSQGVYLMEHVHCPAVLIECGFLSNPAEAERLHDPDYQKRIAAVILSAVVQYKSEAMGIGQV